MRLVKLCLACGQLLPSLLFQYPIAWKLQHRLLAKI